MNIRITIAICLLFCGAALFGQYPYKANTEPVDPNETALLSAIKNKNLPLARQLLDANPVLNAVNYQGRNEINMAVEYLDDTTFIAQLLSKGADPMLKNNWKFNALEQAYYFGSPTVFNFLFQYHMAHSDASYWEHSNMIDMCVSSADTALLIKLLPICDPNVKESKNIDLFFHAISFATTYLYFNKYRARFPDSSTGYYDTKDMDIAVFDVLIKYGYNLNVVDSLGQNFLFKCNMLPEVAKFLIDKGININHEDVYGKTVLQFYIDEIITPQVFEFGITKSQDRDYRDELNILLYYIEHGATLGKLKMSPWCYLYTKAKNVQNKFLLQQLSEYYGQNLKDCN